MEERNIRTALMLGVDAVERLKAARVAVFGVGGVGGHAVDALARAGVGALDLIDNDTVSESNINRQLIATYQTLGLPKVEAFRRRISDINPDCRVTARQEFFLPESADRFDFSQYDYVIDAIDTVSGKLTLAELCQKSGTPIISSMGAGNKLNPWAFEVTDIYKTSVCPLARAMRRELKKRGVKKLKVVYSKETPLPRHPSAAGLIPQGERAPGSISFVPSAAGLIIAGEVIKELIGDC